MIYIVQKLVQQEKIPFQASFKIPTAPTKSRDADLTEISFRG